MHKGDAYPLLPDRWSSLRWEEAHPGNRKCWLALGRLVQVLNGGEDGWGGGKVVVGGSDLVGMSWGAGHFRVGGFINTLSLGTLA